MKKSILFLAAFAALVSCVKENPVEENPAVDTPAVEYQTITFEATAPSASSDDATKTTLVDGGLVHWSNGDQVKVGFFPTTNKQNTIVSCVGTFTATFDQATSASAYFSTDSWNWISQGETINNDRYRDNGLAVYPSSATIYSKRSGSWSPATTDVSYDLPSEQTAVLNSFQSGVNFSYAQVNKTNFMDNKASLSFINACALLKITLPSTAADVKSIVVSSKDDVALSGKFEIPSDKKGGYYNDDPWSSANSDGTLTFKAVAGAGNSSVSIVAPEGETLQPGGTYYVVVWPGNHGSGLDFEFTNSEGLTCKKSLASSVTFTRAKVERFNFVSALDFSFVAELELDTESLSFTKDGGSSTVSVTSNTDWTVSDDADWLTVTQSGKGNGSVTVTAAANTTYEARTATITVTAGTVTKNISVTQDAAERKYKIKSAVSYAADLADGKKYMIFFADGTNIQPYCWKVNDNKSVEKASASYSIGQEYTSEYVFMYDYYAEVKGDELNSSNNGYGSKVVGKLKSEYNNTYLSTSLLFGANEASGMMIMFGNRWTGDTGDLKDIDMWYRKGNGLGSFYYESTIYWNGSLALGSTTNTPRKWFFFEVEEVE
ncbi:MAG: BACON domain-containing protein [Bacteroidales bacterium]|nr:BACON domain-containing protein [Bacteroidales bacterium]